MQPSLLATAAKRRIQSHHGAFFFLERLARACLDWQSKHIIASRYLEHNTCRLTTLFQTVNAVLKRLYQLTVDRTCPMLLGNTMQP